MAVPTISGVTPAQAIAGMLVRIAGTNFKTQDVNNDGIAHPSVTVTIGGIACEATCFSGTLITAIVPDLSPGDIANGELVPAAAYAIAVQNIDTSGAAIAGELATRASSISIVMPKHTSEYESDLVRMVRTFMRLLKRQLIIDVDFAVQTDYDPITGDSLHIAQFAKLPSASLVGPDLTENRFYSLNANVDTDVTGDAFADFVEQKVPFTVDVKFDLVVASDNKVELLNLMSNTVAFFHRNKFLSVLKKKDDVSSGYARFEMDFAENGAPKKIGGSNNSNVESFSCSFLIRGFDVTGMSGFDIATTDGVDATSIVSIGKNVDQVLLARAKQGV